MADQALRDRLLAHGLAGRYPGFVRGGTFFAVVGLAMFLILLLTGDGVRAWQAFHVNWLFFTGLAGGSLAFLAVQKVARAHWSGLLIRFATAPVAFLPVSLVGLVLIFTLGYEPIYGPMQEQLPGLQPGKALWLSYRFMFGRMLVGLTALAWLGWALVRADLVPDLFLARDRADPGRAERYARLAAGFDGSPEARERQHTRIARRAAGYVVLYALVFSAIAFDMIMALQPHWFSNLLGGFFFMGSFLGAHTLLALTMRYGEKELGLVDLISPKQRHDLGKLIFGFTVFWTYLMWAQYLVIWYGNMPEETGFLFARLWGPWRPVGGWVFLGLFLIPFAGLLGVAPKKNRTTLALFAGLSLVSLWGERYLLVLPSITPAHGPVFGVAEAAATLLLGGMFLLSYGLFAREFPMVSPRLAEVTLEREVHHVIDAQEFEHEEGTTDYVSEETIDREKGGE